MRPIPARRTPHTNPIRMSVGSMLKWSASPAHTPNSFPSSVFLYNFRIILITIYLYKLSHYFPFSNDD